MPSLNVFFDVDYTLLAVDGSLRPGTHQVFEKLVQDGHSIYIWSGVGIRTAEIQHHSLDPHVTGIYEKPLEDFEEGLSKFKVPVRPDFVVDDYPQIVSAFGGVVVRPYYFPNRDDDEMDLIYRIFTEFAERGNSEHEAFRPGTPRPRQHDDG